MEFWGVEVKSGQPFDVKLGEDKVLHLSQACLGEIKNNKANESVCIHINIEEKKLVLGTLHPERLPQQLFDLVFDKNFQLSHNWKNGSVYFYGYVADQPNDDQDLSDDNDTDEEEEALRLPIPNEKKEEAKIEAKLVGSSKKEAAGKHKVKIVEPEKEDKADSDDSDDSSSDYSDEDGDDSSDDDEEESDEETPKKEQSGKKRPNDSSMKTPATDKKAKQSTPNKTDGKKAGGHVATPHPSKQAVAKTPANKSNQKSPASASDGAHSCKSCNRTFKTDNALQSHNQAKHK